MDMRIAPLKIKIMFESNPLKSRILVWRLAVSSAFFLKNPVLSNRDPGACLNQLGGRRGMRADVTQDSESELRSYAQGHCRSLTTAVLLRSRITPDVQTKILLNPG